MTNDKKFDQMTEEERADKIEGTLKDYKLWLGSWDALRDLIAMLEDNEQEKAFDNHNNDF